MCGGAGEGVDGLGEEGDAALQQHPATALVLTPQLHTQRWGGGGEERGGCGGEREVR